MNWQPIWEYGEGSKHRILWFHGLGASGRDFWEMPRMISLRKDHAWAFYAPEAPQRPVTCANRMIMPAWFDISTLPIHQQEEYEGLSRMMESIYTWMKKQKDTSTWWVGGFSQGAALALSLGWYQQSIPIQGVIACSGFFPLLEGKKLQPAVPTMQTLFLHGDSDPIVPWSWAQASYQPLLTSPKNVHTVVYPGVEHTMNLEMFSRIGQYLNDMVP